MLNGIDPVISPQLLTALMEMGHGNEIVFADANFPAASHAQRIIWSSGIGIPKLLHAILPLFPLDYAVDYSGILMQPTDIHVSALPVWEEYRMALSGSPNGEKSFLILEKQEFYARAKQAYAVVSTGEGRLFSNLILRKGVIA